MRISSIAKSRDVSANLNGLGSSEREKNNFLRNSLNNRFWFNGIFRKLQKILLNK